MNHDPYTAPATLAASASAETNIDALDVSDRWKQYFKGVRKYGGLQLPLFKQLPMNERKTAASRDHLSPPPVSMLLAFVFGIFYYLAKGMWKKGLVLLAIVIPVLVILSMLLHMIGGDVLSNATRFLGGAIFAVMAPRDFYAFKVEGDKGWLPVRPF